MAQISSGQDGMFCWVDLATSDAERARGSASAIFAELGVPEVPA